MYLQCIFVGLISLFIVGLQSSTVNGASIPSKKPLTVRVQQCREGCLEKFAIKESLCQQRPECSTSGFPPYNYNSLPDALHLLCWDECAKPPPPKLNKTIRETWALRTVSMLQQDSLVLVDVAWAPLNTPNQCLVTWEVSGGGLMGNLLTETFNVQLSLWPDTKYRVQVTCKNKLTGSMSRSLPLNIDTSEAITTHLPPNNIKPIQHLQQTTNTLTGSSSPSSSSSSSSSDSIQTTNVDNQLLSFDDQSNESINHHTNFIFNWHHGTSTGTLNNNVATMDNTINNSDVQVNRIEHLNQSGLNILTIAAITDMQKPLLFGVIAGSLLLTIILFLYVCMLRSQRIPSDKAALIEDDGCVIQSGTTNSSSAAVVAQACGATNHFGGDPSISLNPGYYSKTVHVLAV